MLVGERVAKGCVSVHSAPTVPLTVLDHPPVQALGPVLDDGVTIDHWHGLACAHAPKGAAGPPDPRADELLPTGLLNEVGCVVVAVGGLCTVGTLAGLPSYRAIHSEPVDQLQEVAAGPAFGHGFKVVCTVVAGAFVGAAVVYWNRYFVHVNSVFKIIPAAVAFWII